MDDTRLLTLLTLVKLKSYTKTAKELFITQPSVTLHIKSLEHEYDISIFDGPRSFNLTKQGSILVEYARRMVGQSRELTSAINDSKLDKKKLKLGITSGCNSILYKNNFLEVIFEEYNSDAEIINMNNEDIFNQLKDGKIDFAIIDSSYDDDIFDGIVLDTYNLVPVCYTLGKFENIKRVTREMLKNNSIIMGVDNMGMVAKETLKKANIKLNHNNFYISNSMYTMSKLLETKDGIGFMYNELIPLIDNVKKMELVNFKGQQDIYLLYSQNSFDKSTIRHLIRKLKKWMGN